MSKEKTCCITGPFPQNLPWGYDEESKECISFKKELKEKIEKLINERGITNFITSVNIGVELLAAEEALKLKEKYPQITVTTVMPFETQAAEWSEPFRERYFSVHEKSDAVYSVQARYDDMCTYNTREYMLSNSSVLLAFCAAAHGETGAAVESATKKGNEVIFIPNTL